MTNFTKACIGKKPERGGERNYSHFKVNKPCLTPIYIGMYATYPHSVRPHSLRFIKRNCNEGCEITVIKTMELCACEPRSNQRIPGTSTWGTAKNLTKLSFNQEWVITYTSASVLPQWREPIRNINALSDPDLNIGYWIKGTCGYASVFGIDGGWKILFGSRKEKGVNILLLHNIVGQHDLTELNKRSEACLDALKNGRFVDWR